MRFCRLFSQGGENLARRHSHNLLAPSQACVPRHALLLQKIKETRILKRIDVTKIPDMLKLAYKILSGEG